MNVWTQGFPAEHCPDHSVINISLLVQTIHEILGCPHVSMTFVYSTACHRFVVCWPWERFKGCLCVCFKNSLLLCNMLLSVFWVIIVSFLTFAILYRIIIKTSTCIRLTEKRPSNNLRADICQCMCESSSGGLCCDGQRSGWEKCDAGHRVCVCTGC